MKPSELLDKVKTQPQQPLTSAITANIAKIKKICDDKYYNQSFYGNTALNRQMLLNSEIADLLTPEVILYLFTNPPTAETKIKRNSGGPIALKDAIYYGLKDGLQVVKFMPNNERDYSPEKYAKQQANFEECTLKIVKNINIAAGYSEDAKITVEDLYQHSLKRQFVQVVDAIKSIKKAKKSGELLFVPGYTADDMRSQVVNGLKYVCKILKITVTEKPLTLKDETLDSFCEKLLNSPAALLDGWVVHLFYDRAHLEAALEQDTLISIGYKKYTFEAIFEVIVGKILATPDAYPNCAKEQLYLRFGLVVNHLRAHFPQYVKEIAKSQEEIKEIKYEMPAKVISTTDVQVAQTILTQYKHVLKTSTDNTYLDQLKVVLEKIATSEVKEKTSALEPEKVEEIDKTPEKEKEIEKDQAPEKVEAKKVILSPEETDLLSPFHFITFLDATYQRGVDPRYAQGYELLEEVCKLNGFVIIDIKPEMAYSLYQEVNVKDRGVEILGQDVEKSPAKLKRALVELNIPCPVVNFMPKGYRIIVPAAQKDYILEVAHKHPIETAVAVMATLRDKQATLDSKKEKDPKKIKLELQARLKDMLSKYDYPLDELKALQKTFKDCKQDGVVAAFNTPTGKVVTIFTSTPPKDGTGTYQRALKAIQDKIDETSKMEEEKSKPKSSGDGSSFGKR